MIAYSYDDNFIFTQKVECQYSELDNTFLLPANATFEPIVDFNSDIEYLQLNDGKWCKKNVQITGNYYSILNGIEKEKIDKKDIALYTEISITLNIGDKVHFDIENSKWIYDEIGDITINSLITQKTTEIKSEASYRILSVYPQYKQNNMAIAVAEIQNKDILALKNGEIYNPTADEILSLEDSKFCTEYIALIRSKSKALIAMLNSFEKDKTLIDNINNLNIKNDSFWA